MADGFVHVDFNPNQAQVPSMGQPAKITSFEDLQKVGRGEVVQFPDFSGGVPFVARVRRPSILALAKMGRIPNDLLVQAGQIFNDGAGGLDSSSANMLPDMYAICEIICRAALIEPTYDEITQAGVELTDEQIIAIFNYTQSGVKALESFR